MPTAIEDYISFVKSHHGVKHLVSNYSCFHDNPNNVSEKIIQSRLLFNKDISAKEQYDVIGKMFFGTGPTYFIHVDTLKSLGGYDERFPLQEDYPLFIKMIGAGWKPEKNTRYQDKQFEDCLRKPQEMIYFGAW